MASSAPDHLRTPGLISNRPFYEGINLESSYERTPIGIDFNDHILDIRIWPDLAGWEWKDEDELAEAVCVGLVTQAQADSYYAEGKRAIERLEARRSPFGEGWEEWRPTPHGKFHSYRQTGG